MIKIGEETKSQIRQALRHPVVWWRGADLPEEKIRPWEGGIQFLAEALKGVMAGFVGYRERLYVGMAEGKVPPNWKSVSDVGIATWDAITDPPVGIYMDRKRFGEQVHRWIMRINATLSPLLILFLCFDFGLTPLQRVVQWTLVRMLHDFMSTANVVSETKIWAGITPHSRQRGNLQLSRTLGGHAGNVVGGIPVMLMGLRDALGITDYQIMSWGALISAPQTIFARWLPSYARQRVDFTVKVKGEEEKGEEKAEAEEKFTLRECFAVVRHNRWFIMWTAVNFIRFILPRGDQFALYRFLLPKMVFGGREIGGEVLMSIKSIFTDLPSLLLSPFAIQAVKLFGGKVNFMRAHAAIALLTRTASYLVGYKTFPRLLFMFTMDAIRPIMDLWEPVPRRMVDFEMLDYVEWKTGYRSEGMTQSVDGILNKLIRSNLSSVVGNAVTQWTGYMGWDIEKEEQPQRYLDAIWPLMHIGHMVGAAVMLIALLWFKYPHDPKEVEADLIERRALALKLQEQANAEQAHSIEEMTV